MKYYFGANLEYGAEDVKKALSVLVAEGGIALSLSDNAEYDPSALNQIVGSAVSSGVVPESNSSLKLTLDGGRYILKKGQAVFSDGGIAEIEADEDIAIGPKQYLYITYDPMSNAQLLISSEEQAETKELLLVPIAYINLDGTVKDLRTFAKGKIPAMVNAKWNTLHQETLTFTPAGSVGYVEAEHEISGDFNFIFVQNGSIMSTADINGGKTVYSSSWNGINGKYECSNEYMVLKEIGSSQLRATVIEKSPCRLKLRYYVPTRSTAEISCQVWVGIKG